MAFYLVDTNVLLRSASKDSPQHAAAVDAVSILRTRGEVLVLAPQILIEFWVVASRPTDVNGLDWPIEQVEQEVRKLLTQFPLLPNTPAVFPNWLQLASEFRIVGKRAHDAHLVAWMTTHGVTHLLTFNVSDFQGYPVAAISPDELSPKWHGHNET